ncbi:MAG: MaoC family dehydratase [Bacteroidetes bacterium]|nr:MaoC family dehydratase [Bacteroidota bacterium]MBU1373097.1 MaoC family dehydratase [Bacteroidota bacterium]MBU1484279.1 MaoC family dehydratase [Bacteroidota bacterium]MBU1760310.1 MaoC family dehydratase [Bacteroidota bacterium]MBU2047053.1 MaoC family dehydratase [Bacteroidota bacterium]
MVTINNYEEFEAYLGKEMGVSEWHRIEQPQINLFANATLDHQWIHTDAERAATESPFQKTIAHGYLTLSLIPFLWKQIVSIQNLKMEINYGIEKLRFAQAVTVDSEVRLKVKLTSIANLRGVTKANIGIELEVKDQKKPAFSGEVVFLYHFI